MHASTLKSAAAALVFACSAPAFAGLIQVPGNQVAGTGLGAVNTVVTIQDNTSPGARQYPATESGCVTFTGNVAAPSFACQLGLLGGDNQALNKLWLGSAIAGLARAGDLAVVVNVNEGGNGATATMTHLYLSLFNLDSATQMNVAYGGAPLVFTDSGGNGQSGLNLFVMDTTSATQANGFCPNLSRCVIGGGMQFAAGTTQAGPETMYVAAQVRRVPEPMSLALLGAGLLGLGAARRRPR